MAPSPPDFEVQYRFFRAEEGGRISGPPHQNYRSDWSYGGDDIRITGIYMIWPAFLAVDGTIFPQGVSVPESGRAHMRIVLSEMRFFHLSRLHKGITGYFMEGSRRVAVASVTEILALHENPVA